MKQKNGLSHSCTEKSKMFCFLFCAECDSLSIMGKRVMGKFICFS